MHNEVARVNAAMNNFVWVPVMLTLLVGTGIFLSFRTGWLPSCNYRAGWHSSTGNIAGVTGTPMTFGDVANGFEVTKERVRQIDRKFAGRFP